MTLDPEKLRPLAEQAFAFRQTLSDRGYALMAGALLDERLKLLSEGSLIDVAKLKKEFLGFNGPAGRRRLTLDIR